MRDPLRDAIGACRGVFAWLVVFSIAVNVLMLTAPLYMLQVFDRVLASRSIDTLLMLSVMAGVALLTLAVLEGIRSLALASLSGWLGERLGSTVLRCGIRANVGDGRATAQGLRDLSTVRGFLAGPAVLPIMDAPWTPLFLLVIALLHPLLGLIALVGAILLLVIAVASELGTRTPLRAAARAQADAQRRAEAAVRNADVVQAMGMDEAVVGGWGRHHARALHLQECAGRRSGVLSGVAKFVRLGLQTGMLGVGAWLVIGNELSPGGMIAATILLGRALAPVDQAIGSWKSFVAARESYHALREQIGEDPVSQGAMPLPRPQGRLQCENLTFVHGENREPTLKGIEFDLPPGKALGLVGPSAAGKTTLARLLVGTLSPRFGHVRLDDMDMSQWDTADRGAHVGYLPQDIELFDGSVRENIARMRDADADSVIAAARAASVHELILRLPQGYETRVGEGGAALSGGQRQRIALARALYGNPALVVLDEPNSNLDHAGELALLDALAGLRRSGTTVVMIAHQPNFVRQMDYLLVLGNGTMQMSGPMNEVVARVTGPQSTGVAIAPAPCPEVGHV